ncbi:dTDP-4-dehydrorhamnose reductase [Tropicibacter oceani]|uniref:dTDP-4-dehydrorhamnose reductase n=1 Tax=Tropicibacter oceani TaxID=3058420 RepID=A0ABY8QNB4_9RHOB|nr:dTDP-4-dehydrorhamnose reductase [Tropicibacter oceani]WGW06040.1 dTDP-4-dehydrorhamnose reductase [Tropicibacter oceani]
MILVFGKTGQVATELARLAPDAIFLGRDQADLSDPAACAKAIHSHTPDAVINAAAYTAVDRAEEDEALATVVNGDAPTAMAQACAALDIPLVHISTDYVFDGTGDAPWKPTDPVAPQNAYGRSKLTGEEGIRASGARAVILRTSWVFSAHGNNFVKTMLRLSETRDALSIVDDQIGGPTPARGIASACLTIAGALMAGQGRGTYHYAGTPATSWECFARETFGLAGRQVAVTGIPTADYPTPAKRPLNSRLDCSSLTADFGIPPPDWKAALAETVTELRT